MLHSAYCYSCMTLQTPTNFNIMAWSARALSHRSKSGSSAGLHRTIIARSLRHVWLAYKWGRSESTAVVSHSNGHQLASISCHFSFDLTVLM